MRLRRVLLAIRDPEHAPHAAWRKAAALARVSGATLELFSALSEPGPAGSPQRAAALERARQRLERLAHSPLLKGCRTVSCIEWGHPPHETIVRRVLKTRTDLVVASTHAHGLASRLWLRHTDWELIRHCPSALLLVKSARAYTRPVILAALDPFHVHAKPAQLDRQLLTAAGALATALRGSVHAFHAYMPLVASVQGPMGEPVMWESPEVEQVHGEQVAGEFAREAARAGIPPARRHLLLGDVPSQLAATVRRTRASLVVMGAVSRSALRRLLIGNTAERVLDELSCDALIVKPRGFKTSVPRRG
jgi:universal stress protein E